MKMQIGLIFEDKYFSKETADSDFIKEISDTALLSCNVTIEAFQGRNEGDYGSRIDLVLDAEKQEDIDFFLECCKEVWEIKKFEYFDYKIEGFAINI